jgi:integral membrane protein (TIGR00529 family)
MIDLIKLLAVLAGILFLLWRRWNLGVVLLIASIVIGVLFGRSALGLLEDVSTTLVDPTILRLASIVALILSLGALLKASAKLKGMVQSLEAILPDGRVTSAVIPALIGMLPMAGGAIFSAPMVDEIGDHLNVDRHRKTFINYWFRHVWEWVLPTYPSFILAAALLGLAPRELVLAQWPLTVAAIAAGILFGLAPIKQQGSAPASSRGKNGDLKLLAASIWPIVLVITLSVPLKIDLIISLLVTIALLVLANRLGPRQVWKILREGVSLKPVGLIVSVMLFRQVLDSTGAVSAIPDTLTAAGIPAPAIIFFIPMLAGLLTGLAAGTFGVSFPVIMPLLLAVGMRGGAVALAFAGGFLGVLLSPLHLCLSLTRDYYQAEWGPIYRMLAPSVGVAAAVAVALFLLN